MKLHWTFEKIALIARLSALCALSCLGESARANPQRTTTRVSCPPLDQANLVRLIEASPEKKVHLVFFSGWCSECATHLKKLNNPNSILVGTFDTRARIEKVVNQLPLTNVCFTDAGIGKRLEVKSVPAERTVNLETISLAQ